MMGSNTGTSVPPTQRHQKLVQEEIKAAKSFRAQVVQNGAKYGQPDNSRYINLNVCKSKQYSTNVNSFENLQNISRHIGVSATEDNTHGNASEMEPLKQGKSSKQLNKFEIAQQAKVGKFNTGQNSRQPSISGVFEENDLSKLIGSQMITRSSASTLQRVQPLNSTTETVQQLKNSKKRQESLNSKQKTIPIQKMQINQKIANQNQRVQQLVNGPRMDNLLSQLPLAQSQADYYNYSFLGKSQDDTHQRNTFDTGMLGYNGKNKVNDPYNPTASIAFNLGHPLSSSFHSSEHGHVYKQPQASINSNFQSGNTKKSLTKPQSPAQRDQKTQQQFKKSGAKKEQYLLKADEMRSQTFSIDALYPAKQILHNNFFNKSSDRQQELLKAHGLNVSLMSTKVEGSNESKSKRPQSSQIQVFNQQKNKPKTREVTKKTAEPSITYSGGDTQKQFQSPSSSKSTGKASLPGTKGVLHAMVSNFHDYQNKNKPAQVVVNFNGCQMKVPFSKEVTAKSAPTAVHQPKINPVAASIKVNFDKMKKPAKVCEKLTASKEVFQSKTTEGMQASKKRDEANRSSVIQSHKTKQSDKMAPTDGKDTGLADASLIDELPCNVQIQVQQLRTKQPSINHSRKQSLDKKELQSQGLPEPEKTGTQFAQNLNSNPSKVANIANDKKMKAILNNFAKQLTNQHRDSNVPTDIPKKPAAKRPQEIQGLKIKVDNLNIRQTNQIFNFTPNGVHQLQPCTIENPTFLMLNVNIQKDSRMAESVPERPKKQQPQVKNDLDNMTTVKQNGRKELQQQQVTINQANLNQGSFLQNDQQMLLMNALDEFLVKDVQQAKQQPAKKSTATSQQRSQAQTSNQRSYASSTQKESFQKQPEAQSNRNKSNQRGTDQQHHQNVLVLRRSSKSLINQFIDEQSNGSLIQQPRPSKQSLEEIKLSVDNSASVTQFNAGVAGLKLEDIKQSDEDSYESQVNSMMDDPLIEEKRYLVTMIYTSFTQLNQAVTTTKEFYRIGNKLGEGAFGMVNLAQHILTGHFVAIKSLRKKDLDSQLECKRKIVQEIQILQKLVHHPNIVKLFDSFETNSHLCFVMELCAGGDLLSYVRRRKKLDESHARFFFRQIASGLRYCHKNLVVHRDIKLDNLLIDEEGSIKICDFGVSRQLEHRSQLLSGQSGTPAYMAPEVHAAKNYDGFACDVWSLGVCLFAMVCGAVPFKGKTIEDLAAAIQKAEFVYPDSMDKHLSPEIQNLLQSMLSRDPKKRLSMKKVLKHPWLQIPSEKIQIFNQPELKKIKQQSQPCLGSDEPQRLLTEFDLSLNNAPKQEKPTKAIQKDQTHVWSEQSSNNTDKSVILAPFNSTIEETSSSWMEPNVPKSNNLIRYSSLVREANRQYEFNYNGEVDNGIIITHDSKEDEAQKANLRAELKQLDIFKNNKGTEKLPMVSPNVSGESALSANERSLNNFIDMQMNGKLVINDKLSTYKTETTNPDQLVQPKKPQVSMDCCSSSVAAMSKTGEHSKEHVLADFEGESKPRGSKPLLDKPNTQERPHENPYKPSSQVRKEIEVFSAPNQSEESESSSTGSQKEKIDMLIVCKIENEFGYPEEYIVNCLQKAIKNDATTCYYLLVKEDKHEIVNLLAESPALSRNN